MRVLIIDDHPMVLDAISSVLRDGGHEVVTAPDVPPARALLGPAAGIDVLLLDYNLPSGLAMELLQSRELLPPHVVILSGTADPEDVLYLLEKTPAAAFIPKSIDLEDLPIALGMVVESGSQTTPLIWEPVQRRMLPAGRAFPRGEVLTPREREVFMLLRQGLLDKQIADHLGRSVHTVRVQIRAIKRKRGTTRRAAVQQ